jgi:hypothetical protein
MRGSGLTRATRTRLLVAGGRSTRSTGPRLSCPPLSMGARCARSPCSFGAAAGSSDSSRASAAGALCRRSGARARIAVSIAIAGLLLLALSLHGAREPTGHGTGFRARGPRLPRPCVRRVAARLPTWGARDGWSRDSLDERPADRGGIPPSSARSFRAVRRASHASPRSRASSSARPGWRGAKRRSRPRSAF